MSKKRTGRHGYKPNKQKQSRRDDLKRVGNRAMENLVLGLLYRAETGLSLVEIEHHLADARQDLADLKTALRSLSDAGLVQKDGKRHFRIDRRGPLYEGTLVQHPKGFGFLTVKRGPKGGELRRDPFISSSLMAEAHHGDTVLVRIFRVRNDDRPEGGVVTVLVAGPTRLAGIYVEAGRDRLVYPDDRRFPFIIRLDTPGRLHPNSGDAVIAEFRRGAFPARVLPGELVEVLGRTEEVDTQLRLVIEQFDLPCQFSAEALREAAGLAAHLPADPTREDLRATAHITIDGEDARDFDDAVCVEKTRKGFRLHVSIADVSHYVLPGSAIDQEAYARGTSIYFPGRVLPMLPERLSNELCSLVPGQDRLTVSAILDFDRAGSLLARRFCRSIITSRHRFTYTTVRQILVDRDPAIRRDHRPFLTQLKWAGELATVLQERRQRRGALGFNLPEPRFVLTGSGEVASIGRAERNFAHQIIEQLMLAANEAVAEEFSRRSEPSIYRVHEPPDPLKAQEFAAFVARLGLAPAAFANEPSWYAEVLRNSESTTYRYLISTLLLRTMKQARYSAKNVGHFGLAAEDYTHFTSPIRRYPDLLAHRRLLAGLLPPSGHPGRRPPNLKEAAEFLSGREQTAVTAERDMASRLQVGFMRKHIGEVFDAIVSGLTDQALYVELQDLCISGSIPLELLDDDYYLLDGKNYRLFGESTGRTFRIGDGLRVEAIDADLLTKKIIFRIAARPE